MMKAAWWAWGMLAAISVMEGASAQTPPPSAGGSLSPMSFQAPTPLPFVLVYGCVGGITGSSNCPLPNIRKDLVGPLITSGYVTNTTDANAIAPLELVPYSEDAEASYLSGIPRTYQAIDPATGATQQVTEREDQGADGAVLASSQMYITYVSAAYPGDAVSNPISYFHYSVAATNGSTTERYQGYIQVVAFANPERVRIKSPTYTKSSNSWTITGTGGWADTGLKAPIAPIPSTFYVANPPSVTCWLLDLTGKVIGIIGVDSTSLSQGTGGGGGAGSWIITAPAGTTLIPTSTKQSVRCATSFGASDQTNVNIK